MNATLDPTTTYEQAQYDSEVAELTLLLPRWQIVALESAATRRGLTTGQVLRRVIAELFQNQPTADRLVASTR
jgi:hypothetical protein